MKKYIAFLRGINISGKNKVAMPLLKAAFEEIGFTDVVTYINSGNVIFSSESADKSELIQKCEAVITAKFDLKIPVTVADVDDLAETVKHAPDWWNQEKETVHYAIFMIAPMTVPEVFAAVGEIKPEYEKIAYHDEVIFWSAPRKTFNKARWSKIASSSVNNHVTIRTANTVSKLLAMG